MKSRNINKRAFIVGIFTFLGLAIFVVTILTLGGQQKTFSKSITVKAIFNDVEGLQKGNNVWFSGVKIGTVKRVSFYGSSQVEVDLNIQESSSEYIRRDAKAKISSDGLIGNRIVVIYDGSDNAPGIQEGDVLHVDKAVTTDAMLATLQSNNENLLAITTDFKNISKKLADGQGTIGKLISDETLVVQLQQTMVTLRDAAVNADRITQTVSSYAAQLNRKGTLANDLVTDTVVFARLKSSAAQVERLTQTSNQVVNNLKITSQSIHEALNSPNTPLGVLLQDRRVADELKVTLTNLNTSSQKLDENLEALQHNFLLRGFFRKKAKREQEAAEKALQNTKETSAQ